jgi:hypothetical protein
MTTLSDQNRFAKRSTNALRRGDNRAPNFRVELRALEPACTASYVAINVRYWGVKRTPSHGRKSTICTRAREVLENPHYMERRHYEERRVEDQARAAAANR